MGHFKDGPFGTFKRVARSRSLCLALPLSYSRFPLVCPSHLSPCQDSSFIYRKAFIQINTATQQLLCTRTRTHAHTARHAHFVQQHTPRSWLLIRAKQNTAVLALFTCLFDSCLCVCRLFSLNTLSSFFIHLISDCSLSILSSVCCTCEKALA